MSILSPSAGASDYPNFTGYDSDNRYDVGSKVSPEAEYFDAWLIFQIQCELLKFQSILESNRIQFLTPEAIGTPKTDPAELDELQEAPVLKFVDAATKAIIFNTTLDAEGDVNVQLVWCSPATSGVCRWQVEYRVTDENDPMNAVWETPENVDSTVSAVAYGDVRANWSKSGLTAGGTLMMKISRLGAHGSDTLADTAYLALIKVTAT